MIINLFLTHSFYSMKYTFNYFYLLLVFFFLLAHPTESQDFMINAFSRENKQSLNGKWDAIVDAYSRGERMRIFRDQKPTSNTHFLEYSFDGGLQLNVPGDWNHQSPELKYYEGNLCTDANFKPINSRTNEHFSILMRPITSPKFGSMELC